MSVQIKGNAHTENGPVRYTGESLLTRLLTGFTKIRRKDIVVIILSFIIRIDFRSWIIIMFLKNCSTTPPLTTFVKVHWNNLITARSSGCLATIKDHQWPLGPGFPVPDKSIERSFWVQFSSCNSGFFISSLHTFILFLLPSKTSDGSSSPELNEVYRYTYFCFEVE